MASGAPLDAFKQGALSGPPLRRLLTGLVWLGIFLTLLVPAFVDPGLFYPFFSSKVLLFQGSVLLCFASWSLLSVFEPEYRPKVKLVSLAVLGNLVILSLSVAFSPDPHNGVWSSYERMSGLVLHAHLAAFFFVLASFLRREVDWHRLFLLSATVASCISLIGILDHHGALDVIGVLESLHLIPGDFTRISRSGSLLGNTSFLGTYLQINAFFSVFLVLSTSGKKRWFVGLLLAVISCGILLNPGGRAMKASFLLGLCGIAVFLILFRAKSPRVRKIAFSTLLAATPIVLLCGILLSFHAETLLSGAMEVRGVEERVLLWTAATAGFFDRPVLGWGLENFDLMLYQHFDPAILVGPGRKISPPWFDRAHNVVLDTLISAGAAGLIAYLLMMTASVFALGKAARQSPSTGVKGFVVFTALFLSHFVQNLTVFDMVSSQMLLYASFAYASWGAPNHGRPLSGFKDDKPFNRMSVLAWACTVPFLIFTYRACVQVPWKIGRVVGGLDGRPADTGLLEDAAAVSGDPTVGRNQVRVRLAEVTARRLITSTDPGLTETRLEEVEYVLRQLDKSERESPANFQIPFIAGRLNARTAVWLFENFSGEERLLERSSRYADASIIQYRKAIAICEYHALAYIELSRAQVYKGYISGNDASFREALATADAAIQLEPRLFASHELAVDIAANLLKDRGVAMERLNNAVGIVPTWRGSLRKIVRGEP
jgi:O-antigen ligase